MASRIEDYALLGDTESAALVGKDGSIDWLTVPRFDSPACFAALLGNEGNGRWQIAPASRVLRVERSYRPGSLVLETVFHTAEGSVALIDCLPPRDGRYDLTRLVEGRSGSVPMRLHLTIRFDYGSIVPWVRRCPGGITAVGGPDAIRLATPVDLRSENLETTAEFTVAAGQRVPFTLTWYPSDTPAPQPIDAVTAIAESEAWWRAWSSGCTYDGDYADEVLSSLTVLKGLTYAPSGGLVAAATTSLPEAIGGARNWDYRYCWLRDATFSLMALLNAGFTTEAAAWRDWLLRTVAGSPEQLQIMYGASGERRLTELELDWLGGYEGSTAGARRQRRARAVPARRVRRGARRAAPGSLPRPHRGARLVEPAAAARRLRGGPLERARRRPLGGPRRPPGLHPLQGDGLGGGRPGDRVDRGLRLRRPARPLEAAA